MSCSDDQRGSNMYRVSFRTDDIGWRVWEDGLPTLKAARAVQNKLLKTSFGYRPVTHAVIIRERDSQQIESKDWTGKVKRHVK